LLRAAKMAALSAHLAAMRDAAWIGGRTMDALLPARDLTLFMYAWSCGERAGEAGKLRQDCVAIHDDGRVAIDYEATERGLDLTRLGRGKKQVTFAVRAWFRDVEIFINNEKQVNKTCCFRPFQAKRARTAAIWVPSAVDVHLDAAAALRVYGDMRTAHPKFFGVPADGEPNFLFTALVRDGSHFGTTPLSANAVTDRLQGYLIEMGQFNGETSHSLKRGGLVASELSNSELAKMVSLTEGTIARYRDVRRGKEI
jgi:integrase